MKLWIHKNSVKVREIRKVGELVDSDLIVRGMIAIPSHKSHYNQQWVCSV
jgi:hypothetical protein